MNADDYFNNLTQKFEALSNDEFDKLILECTGKEEPKKRKRKKNENANDKMMKWLKML